MKKIILLLSASLLLISVSSIAPTVNANATSIDSSISTLSGDYSFVGEFYFYPLGNGNVGMKYPVYEASNACGQYYAYYDGTYYKLFSCREAGGYNYYFAKEGVKWYAKI
jgi:hypothetical protein